MIYLIEYHRRAGRLVSLDEFPDEDRATAEARRFELELRLNRKRISHEVVLLEAENGQDLLETHRRYFEGLSALTDRMVEYPAARL